LFLALAGALAVGGLGDAYAAQRVLVDGAPGSLARLALVAGQASFIAWFGLLAAVLQLTPTGRPLSARWRAVLVGSSVGATLALVAKFVQDTEFEAPYASVRNPWAIEGAAPLVDLVAFLGITVAMLGLVVAAASLLVRFRRAEGEERSQLHWLALVVVPLPVLVVASFVASVADAPVVRTLVTGGYVAVVPIAAGLSVLRFRLYDVDRILSRAAAYALSTLALGVVFLVVTAASGRALGLVVDDTVVPAVLGTVATVAAALPVHRRLQEALDRRFDRRRYDAHRIVREHLGAVRPASSLEATLARALRDPSLSLAYWLPAAGRWATADGHPATLEPGDIEVSRDGEPVGRLRIDRDRTDVRLASALATDVLAELDNVRLRAEVSAQLEEVRASRARIVAAQTEERHRIERNLHDGAQQRLLGLALQLRAEQLGEGASPALLDHAVDEIGAAVRDLRALASGLHPHALDDVGLAGALDEAAGRMRERVDLDLPDERLPAATEATLWFVATEAMANAAKHAAARVVRIEVRRVGELAHLRVVDDGGGGADPEGSGLRGLADRVEAAGGSFRLTSPIGVGTTIEAVIPCGS